MCRETKGSTVSRARFLQVLLALKRPYAQSTNPDAISQRSLWQPENDQREHGRKHPPHHIKLGNNHPAREKEETIVKNGEYAYAVLWRCRSIRESTANSGRSQRGDLRNERHTENAR